MMGIHRCDVCGKREEWNDKWATYGSLLLSDYDRSSMVVTCSEACRKSDTIKPLIEKANTMHKLALADWKKFLRESESLRGYGHGYY